MTERKYSPNEYETDADTLGYWKRKVLLVYAERAEDGIKPRFKEHKDVAIHAYAEKLGEITGPELLKTETRKCTVHAAAITRTFVADLRAMQAGATFNTKRPSNTPEILAELQALFPGKSIE